jgi:3-dehydroquinate synthase
MRRVTVPLPDREYPILIGTAFLERAGSLVHEAGLRGAAALVQDSAVAGTYGAAVRASLEAAGYRVAPVVVPSGEGSKSLAQLGRLYDALAEAEIDRASFVVALGGGVAGDLAGFAAATFLRGIDFVQIPTTLLAQVDASVGGKTGIDLPSGKNLAGAFHQPRLVLIDLDTLRTLPEAEVRAGMAEIVKYGVIADSDLFEYLESNLPAVRAHQPDVLAHLVGRSCEIKAEVVGKDERESGLRAILNYGHTVGHAVEAVAGYGTYLHGEAVAIGMAAAGEIAVRLGWLAAPEADRIRRLLAAYGLPTRLRAPLAETELLHAMRRDKKSRAGELRFVLARRIGAVEVTPVPEELVRAGLAAVAAEA